MKTTDVTQGKCMGTRALVYNAGHLRFKTAIPDFDFSRQIYVYAPLYKHV